MRASTQQRKLGRSLFALAMAGAIGTALAQQAAKTDGALVLETVVVTAQKRAQSLGDVPISMTVVGANALEKTHATTLSDMQQLVPNLSVAYAAGVNTITVRGVGGGGRNIGFDTRVGVYLDGIYMGQAQAVDQPLADIEQVEVLRGPQGHLFGRNTVAGAVNITTRAPSETPETSFLIGAGKFNSVEASGSFSGPLSDGVLGKIAVGHEKRDGFTSNLATGNKIDDMERSSIRGQLMFKPTGKLKIGLYADYSDSKQHAIVGEAGSNMFDYPYTCVTKPTPVVGLCPPRTVNYNVDPVLNNTLKGGSLNINYDLDGGGTLTAITGYRNTHQNRVNDTDYSPADMFNIDYTDNFKQYSQELRVASPAKDALRYVAGLYVMNEKADTYRMATVGQESNALIQHPAVPFPLPFGALLGLNAGGTVLVSGKVKTDAYAFFGSLDYDLTKTLTLNLGARYTKETKDLLYNLNGAASGGIGIGNATNYTDDRSDSKLTPTVGMTFALDKNLNLYAKYSTGFKSGGWNVDYLTQAQINNKFSFNTETVKSYEAGLKGTALGRRMQYDLAVFQSTFKDFQVFQFVNLGGGATAMQLRNAAKAESTGVEGSLRLRATDNFTVGANIGALKAVFKSFPGGVTGGADAAGKRLPDAPDVSAALTMNYAIAAPSLGGRFDLYAEYSYRSKSFADVDNSEILGRLGARNVVNTRLTFQQSASKWQFGLWVRNLTDNEYLVMQSRDFFGNAYSKRGEPRMFGVDLKGYF